MLRVARRAKYLRFIREAAGAHRRTGERWAWLAAAAVQAERLIADAGEAKRRRDRVVSARVVTRRAELPETLTACPSASVRSSGNLMTTNNPEQKANRLSGYRHKTLHVQKGSLNNHEQNPKQNPARAFRLAAVPAAQVDRAFRRTPFRGFRGAAPGRPRGLALLGAQGRSRPGARCSPGFCGHFARFSAFVDGIRGVL